MSSFKEIEAIHGLIILNSVRDESDKEVKSTLLDFILEKNKQFYELAQKISQGNKPAEFDLFSSDEALEFIAINYQVLILSLKQTSFAAKFGSDILDSLKEEHSQIYTAYFENTANIEEKYATAIEYAKIKLMAANNSNQSELASGLNNFSVSIQLKYLEAKGKIKVNRIAGDNMVHVTLANSTATFQDFLQEGVNQLQGTLGQEAVNELQGMLGHEGINQLQEIFGQEGMINQLQEMLGQEQINQWQEIFQQNNNNNNSNNAPTFAKK